MKKELYIVRSETFFDDAKFDDINKILKETIDDFVTPADRIISIETKEHAGMLRFWIYIESANSLKPL